MWHRPGRLGDDRRVARIFTLASAMARVFDGLDTTTRPTSGVSSTAIASLLPVASNTT